MRASALIGALLASACVVVAPATAAPKTLLGVYEDAVTLNCTNATSCVGLFALLSSPLLITKVSCNITYPKNSHLLSAVLGMNSGSTFSLGQLLAPVQALDLTTRNNSLLATTDYALASGVQPAVSFAYDQTGSFVGRCTISGSQ